MNEIYVTMSGRLVADPESRNTKSGRSALHRLPDRLDGPPGQPRAGEYEDAETSFFNVTAFRALGANVASSLHKGDPVIVYGRMRVNQWIRATTTPRPPRRRSTPTASGTTCRSAPRVPQGQPCAGRTAATAWPTSTCRRSHAGFEVGDADTDEYIVGEEDEGAELGPVGSREGADALTPA